LAIAHNALGQYESAIHVLSTIGLPELVYEGFRTGAEWDGFIALMNAHYGSGNIQMAREMAQFSLDYGDVTDLDWWWNLNVVCEQAILGQDDQARDRLKMLQNGTHLPWDPILKDSPCFDRFQGDPTYQATVRHYDERRAILRERLPDTLAEFGVKL
jgi:hypothetical protein